MVDGRLEAAADGGGLDIRTTDGSGLDFRVADGGGLDFPSDGGFE